MPPRFPHPAGLDTAETVRALYAGALLEAAKRESGADYRPKQLVAAVRDVMAADEVSSSMDPHELRMYWSSVYIAIRTAVRAGSAGYLSAYLPTA